MRVTRYVLSALALTVAMPAMPAHAAALLAPHRAVYDLSLEDADDRSGITGIAGRMVYEFDGSACEGYTVTFRFVTRIDTDEASRLSDMQTTTYEDAEGKSFSFVTKSFVDQELDKEVKGTATLQANATAVRIEKPEPKSVSIQKTQFPTQHLIELIEKAKKAENFYETTIFDGSEDADKVMTTTVVIGREEAGEERDPELKAMDELGDDRFWPVEIAYFDLSEGNGEEIPSYRIAFKLHENGITRDLLMDYGDFAMKGQLVDLEMLKPASTCSQ
jgi:hypothetical protein